MAKNVTIQDLLELDTDIDVMLTIDGDEYEATVVGWSRQPAERIKGIPSSGYVSVDLEVNDATVEKRGLPTHSLYLNVTEKRPGRWDTEMITVSVWTPEIDDEGYIVQDDYEPLGELTEVKT